MQLEVQLVARAAAPAPGSRPARRLLDRRRRDALGEHRDALVDERPDHARGEEAARVVDDDRRLADLLGDVERAVERLVGGLLALDDLQQRHLVHGGEEVQADEVGRARTPSASSVIGSVEVLEPSSAPSARCGSISREHLRLDLRVLEDRLDHQVGALGVGGVGRRRDQGEELVALLLRGLAALDGLGDELLRVALAASAAAWSTSLSTTSMPAFAHTYAIAAPIMPAPSTTTFLACEGSIESGPAARRR